MKITTDGSVHKTTRWSPRLNPTKMPAAINDRSSRSCDQRIKNSSVSVASSTAIDNTSMRIAWYQTIVPVANSSDPSNAIAGRTPSRACIQYSAQLAPAKYSVPSRLIRHATPPKANACENIQPASTKAG
jgi:hypothetical protein